ncbi:MAG: YicC/YloC family endoribonuclease [Flavobacteriales bacterium]|jgi:uncharacterized protein (TIGR00255 family)|nr:MAG: YicC/YloC family endoribonuclease [Flavobacteriales bacterium]
MAKGIVRSMTGFGRAEGVVKDRKVTVELRSLNSKQLDLLLKLPGAYKEREQELRQALSERVVRGKAEAFIAMEAVHAAKRTSFDRPLIKAYYEEIRGIVQEIAPDSPVDIMAQVLRLPDVASTSAERLDEEEWEGLKGLLRAALDGFDRFRCEEGARLAAELVERLAAIEALLSEVEALDQGRADRVRDRLRAKLAELQADIDQDRYEQELIYYLEKLDITEEKVRLRAHCAYFRETIQADEQQGRKLGFIAQEMGREINTIGSKANDAVIQRLVVRMKDELEKVKEQLLNVL